MIFITGEAGIGKTSLIDRFLGELPPASSRWAARGQCVEHRGQAEPYMPVLDALGRLCRGPAAAIVIEALDRFAPSWLVQMPGMVSADRLIALQQRLVGQTRERMLHEIEDALIAATVDATLVLVLEDLHWSDASTIDFLARIGRGTDLARLLVIGTYRPADAASSSHPIEPTVRDMEFRRECREIALPLLSRTSVNDYIHDRFEGAVPEPVVSLLHQRTEGSPLFIATLLDAWRATGIINEAGGTWNWNTDVAERALDMPDSLRSSSKDRSVNCLMRSERCSKPLPSPGSGLHPPLSGPLWKRPPTLWSPRVKRCRELDDSSVPPDPWSTPTERCANRTSSCTASTSRCSIRFCPPGVVCVCISKSGWHLNSTMPIERQKSRPNWPRTSARHGMLARRCDICRWRPTDR